jgi:hypothetical protein
MYDFGFAALDILDVYPEDSGEYTIKATNRVGSASSSLRLNVTGECVSRIAAVIEHDTSNGVICIT